jgi:hypothetical protein
MSRRCRRLHLRVEALEDRFLPASTAAVSAGLLTITGDSASINQNIAITQTTTPGTYDVAITDNGTSVLNQTFGGVTNIRINAGAGNDTVTFGGNALSGSGLTGNLSINGADQLTVSIGGSSGGFNVGGQAAITDTSPTQAMTLTVTGPATTLGSLAVTGSDGGSSTTIQDGAVIAGPAAFVFGNGNDNVSLEAGASGQPGAQVDGLLSFNGGGGSNSLSILNSSAGALALGAVGNVTLDAATINGGILTTFTSQSTVTMSNQTVVKGFVSLNGSTTSVIDVNVTDSSVNDFFSVTSGVFGGDDSITLTNSKVGTNLGMGLGAGIDTLALNNTTVGGTLVINGAGDLVVNVEQGSHIAGFVSLNETGGLSSDTITLSNSTVAGFFSVTTGPGSADSITFIGATIGQAVGFGLGTGTDTVNISRSTVGGSVLVRGQGNLLFGLTENSSVGAFVSLNESANPSTDTVSVSSSTVGGFFSVASGQGSSDSISMNSVSVGGAFGLGLGTGASTLSLGNLTTQGGFIVNTGASPFNFAGPTLVIGNQIITLTPANAASLLAALLGISPASAAGSTTTTTPVAPSSPSSSSSQTTGGGAVGTSPTPAPGGNVLQTIFGPGTPTGDSSNSGSLTQVNDLGSFFGNVFTSSPTPSVPAFPT